MPCPGKQNLIKNGEFMKSELMFQLTEPRKCCRSTTKTVERQRRGKAVRTWFGSAAYERPLSAGNTVCFCDSAADTIATADGSAWPFSRGARSLGRAKGKRHTRLAGSAECSTFSQSPLRRAGKRLAQSVHIPERFLHRVQVQG